MKKINPRKPTELRTCNLIARCDVDPKSDTVVITLTDRGLCTEAGCTIPSNYEMKKLNEWMRKVRAYSDDYSQQKVEQECPSE